MKNSKYAVLCAFLVTIIFPATFLRASDDGNITVSVSVVAMPKDLAMAFIAKPELKEKPEEILKELMGLVEKKSAQNAGNPSVTTKSGQRALTEADAVKLEVEPVESPDGKMVDVNLALTYFKNKITTSLTVNTGGVKYLGSFDSAGDGRDGTCLVFIRVDAGK